MLQRILKVCWKDKASNTIVRENVEKHSLHNNRFDEAEEAEATWLNVDDKRQTTSEDGDARNHCRPARKTVR